jgi:5-methylcytosine-specific restriction endonuclease McrA
MSLSPQVAALFQPYAPLERVGGVPSRKWRSKRHRDLGSLMPRMLEAQGGFCGICGERLRNSPSFDHVVPRCRGGANAGNRIVAHTPCNFRKADRMPTGCEVIMLAAVNARLAA